MPKLPATALLALAITLATSGCSSPPRQLDGLPRTPQASVEQILQDASRRKGPEANLLRLHAAQAALNNAQHQRVMEILAQVPQSELPADQQIRFSELQASAALLGDRPKLALRAISHASLQQLDQRPMEEQLRIQLLRADVFEVNKQHLEAARERIFIDALLPAERQPGNRAGIWESLRQLPVATLASERGRSGNEMDGWIELALIAGQAGNLDLQVREIQRWQGENNRHAAAMHLPGELSELLELHARRPQRIALLLPLQGQLSAAGEALRDGFLSAQYQAFAEGFEQPEIRLYDSSQFNDTDSFYRQAIADGMQWVIGPLERDRVSQLARRDSLPLPTLALNYSEQAGAPANLFQFGLAPEDEARSAALRAWADGHRSMAILSSNSDWGQRTQHAFREQWQALGGRVVGHELLDQPTTMANQIGQLLQIRQSEQRNTRIQSLLGNEIAVQPTPRQDIEALFVAATPQQARQLMPTLAFQYAADLPVYATSHAFQYDADSSQMADLDGILIAETPWLLSRSDSLYPKVTSHWPQASGPLGRLYAMGIDAQRIFSRLPQLQSNESLQFSGATGLLSLPEDGRIRRELDWGVIRNGRLGAID